MGKSEDVRILSWGEVQEIVDQFESLNRYDPAAVKGSLLNLVDANFTESHRKKTQRQLYGYSIAAKRYALSEKTGKSEIKVIDPKAHGIGFLYQPADSPEDWEESVPNWIFEYWDCILRDALYLSCKRQAWLDLPQMMRLTITTCNVLEMLGGWEIACPYNFLFLPMIDPVLGFPFPKQNGNVLLVCPFSSEQKKWFDLTCVDVHSEKEYQLLNCKKQIENIPQNAIFPSQFARLRMQYQRHPEAKSLAPDGTACAPETTGLLKRAHVIAGDIRYVGKETDRKWEAGEDPSALEFKATEYGRSGKVLASQEVKDVAKFESSVFQPEAAQNLLSVDLSIPPVAELVLRFAQKKRCSLHEAIMTVRESKHARAFRKWCARFASHAMNGRPGAKKSN